MDGLRKAIGQAEAFAAGVLIHGSERNCPRRKSGGDHLYDKIFDDPSDAALSAKAANPNAAKVFIEYLCSSEGQKKVAETGEFVLHPGIYPSLKGADKLMANMVFMDNPNGEQLTKLQNEFRQISLLNDALSYIAMPLT